MRLDAPTLTLLHTAPSHVPRFTAVLQGLASKAKVQHVVREDLLDEARIKGEVDAALSQKLGGVLGSLAPSSSVILCTCSTLGAAAESFSALGVPVLRVDRPLARAAVVRGSCIAVVAALASTLEPTRALLEEEAVRAGVDVRLELVHVERAWQHFGVGELETYLRVIAEHVDEVAPDADVIVLAQASMAGAERFVKTHKPVLSSPELGVEAALEVLSRLRP